MAKRFYYNIRKDIIFNPEMVVCIQATPTITETNSYNGETKTTEEPRYTVFLAGVQGTIPIDKETYDAIMSDIVVGVPLKGKIRENVHVNNEWDFKKYPRTIRAEIDYSDLLKAEGDALQDSPLFKKGENK